MKKVILVLQDSSSFPVSDSLNERVRQVRRDRDQPLKSQFKERRHHRVRQSLTGLEVFTNDN